MFNLEKELQDDELGKKGIENDAILDYFVNNVKDYVLDYSSSSCYIHDIEAFVYGPFTSRFWMLRKHIMMMDQMLLANLPFFGWECLSLQLKNRGDVYILIQNEKVMADFLKLLIFELKTLDGNAGSALKRRDILFK